MKHMEAVDVRHTYYMINFLHERTTTQFKMMADNTRRKVKHNQRIAEADLCRYIDEVKENIDNLPKVWQQTYEAHKGVDNKTLAKLFIEQCRPY